MSTLTLVLAVIAGLLMLAAVTAIYITNVTARQSEVPRWVLWICGGSLVTGAIALITGL